MNWKQALSRYFPSFKEGKQDNNVSFQFIHSPQRGRFPLPQCAVCKQGVRSSNILEVEEF